MVLNEIKEEKNIPKITKKVNFIYYYSVRVIVAVSFQRYTLKNLNNNIFPVV